MQEPIPRHVVNTARMFRDCREESFRHIILMEELEDMDDIRLYDKAKASKEPSIPIDQAFKAIEAKRNKKQRL